MATPSPYKPPRAPVDVPAKADPPTVGYLVGVILQLALGAIFLVVNALQRQVSLLGLLLVFFGLRSFIKYRARMRASRS